MYIVYFYIFSIVFCMVGDSVVCLSVCLFVCCARVFVVFWQTQMPASTSTGYVFEVEVEPRLLDLMPRLRCVFFKVDKGRSIYFNCIFYVFVCLCVFVLSYFYIYLKQADMDDGDILRRTATACLSQFAQVSFAFCTHCFC